MILQHFGRLGLSLLGVTAALLVTAAVGGFDATAGTKVATFNNGTWTPTVSYDTATLRVSGPDGYVHQKTVSAGQPISIGGVNLVDGQYSYDLKLFNNNRPYLGAEDRKLPPEQSDSNGRAQDMTDRRGSVTVYEQSGGFQVKHGSIVWNPQAQE